MTARCRARRGRLARVLRLVASKIDDAADRGLGVAIECRAVGGPGATGRSFSDFATIITSIREKLLTLPDDTVINPGHGDSGTVADEAPALPEWIARGH